jgi:hypothetical protein
MHRDTTTLAVEIDQTLIDAARECATDRGFRDLDAFVETAIRGAIEAEGSLRPDVRHSVREHRKRAALGEESSTSLDDLDE